MFRRLAASFTDGATKLARLHPLELTGFLERAWNFRVDVAGTPLGHPDHRSHVPGLDIPRLPRPAERTHLLPNASPTVPVATPVERSLAAVLGDDVERIEVRWDHLIYAYMVENTKIYEIFRRVIHEFLFGEKLGIPSEDTLLWLRNTEELFYRDPPPFSIVSISSHIRSDLRETRRNAYQRFFGMELNHGNDDNTPYRYVKAEAANNEFVTTLEEMLREAWVGYINRSTTSGANPSDDSKIFELVKKIHDMLMTRRQNGNLSREEFFFVAMMSWFHLTVDNPLPIMKDLRADGVSAEQRLFKIAQMVGMPAHGLSGSYFDIAEPLSELLIAIESGIFTDVAAVRVLYDPTSPNTLSGIVNKVITHWSIITGHDLKAGKVAVR